MLRVEAAHDRVHLVDASARRPGRASSARPPARPPGLDRAAGEEEQRSRSRAAARPRRAPKASSVVAATCCRRLVDSLVSSTLRLRPPRRRKRRPAPPRRGRFVLERPPRGTGAERRGAGSGHRRGQATRDARPPPASRGQLLGGRQRSPRPATTAAARSRTVARVDRHAGAAGGEALPHLDGGAVDGAVDDPLCGGDAGGQPAQAREGLGVERGERASLGDELFDLFERGAQLGAELGREEPARAAGGRSRSVPARRAPGCAPRPRFPLTRRYRRHHVRRASASLTSARS